MQKVNSGSIHPYITTVPAVIAGSKDTDDLYVTIFCIFLQRLYHLRNKKNAYRAAFQKFDYPHTLTNLFSPAQLLLLSIEVLKYQLFSYML